MKKDQIMPIEVDSFSTKSHKDILDHIQPSSPSWEELINTCIMKFIKIECIKTFLTSKEDVLIMCIWMDPASTTEDTEWTFIEYFRETSTHHYFRCWWKSIS